ncbi:MAG: hypothetical protein ACEQSX_10270, partial [Baekduiaceae bacterium]
MVQAFTWRDGDRTVRFGRGVVADAQGLLGAGFTLLTTPRAESAAPAVAAAAAVTRHGPAGRVDEVAA